MKKGDISNISAKTILIDIYSIFRINHNSFRTKVSKITKGFFFPRFEINMQAIEWISKELIKGEHNIQYFCLGNEKIQHLFSRILAKELDHYNIEKSIFNFKDYKELIKYLQTRKDIMVTYTLNHNVYNDLEGILYPRWPYSNLDPLDNDWLYYTYK